MNAHRFWGVVLTLALTVAGLCWLYAALLYSQTQCDIGPCGLGQPWADLQLFVAAAGILAAGAVGPLVYMSKTRKLKAALLGVIGSGAVWVLVIYGAS